MSRSTRHRLFVSLFALGIAAGILAFPTVGAAAICCTTCTQNFNSCNQGTGPWGPACHGARQCCPILYTDCQATCDPSC
jgi:hypothetical protein